MIPEWAKPSHRILYIGVDYGLPALLGDALKCLVVRCPDETQYRLFLTSDLKYSLLLFDGDLPNAAEPEKFVRSLKHRERTPIVALKKSEEFDQLVYTVGQLLLGLSKI
jgi:hypothetical protein